MAIDRDILIKQITKGGEFPAYGWVPPGMPGYEQQQVSWAGTDQKAARGGGQEDPRPKPASDRATR